MVDKAINAIRKVPRQSLSFSWFRSTFRWDHDAKDALDYGHAVIGTTDGLAQYLHSYGPMIKSQWENVAPMLAAIDPPATIVDYGCGQGLAGLLANDLTHSRIFADVRQIVLIEPSVPALERAVALYERLAPQATVTALARRFDDVRTQDLPSAVPGATLHLFSNSLDVPGYDALDLLKQTVRAGQHVILSVSHDRPFNGGSPRVEELAAIMTKGGEDGHLLDCRSRIERFTCDNPGGPQESRGCANSRSRMADLFAPAARPLPFALPETPGFNSSWNEHLQGFDVEVPGGAFFYAEHFFPKAWSDRMVAYLQENGSADWRTIDWRKVSPDALEAIAFGNIRWKQDSMKLYGKHIPLPRLTAWYGDPGAAYTYSGIKSEPNPWTDGLLHIKHRIEDSIGDTFNCVLLNWYRDGKDSLSWHADDEKELGIDPVIASANFGATRDFQLRRNSDHAEKITIPLKHGTLLVMRGALQQNWKHAVPKRTGVDESRFNMTFRTIHG